VVHRDVEPWAEWLTVHKNLVVTAQRICEFRVHRLNEEGEVVLVGRV
jgi:hypothetical protein